MCPYNEGVCAFPVLPGWYEVVMTGDGAAILDHEMEGTCWEWQSNETEGVHFFIKAI